MQPTNKPLDFSLRSRLELQRRTDALLSQKPETKAVLEREFRRIEERNVLYKGKSLPDSLFARSVVEFKELVSSNVPEMMQMMMDRFSSASPREVLAPPNAELFREPPREVLSLEELKLGESLTGRTLVGFVMTPPQKTFAGVHVLLQLVIPRDDEASSSEPDPSFVVMTVRNFVESTATRRTLDALFPVGSLVMLLEPYLTSSALFTLYVCADNPARLFIKRRHHGEDPQTTIRELGNKAYAERDYEGAKMHYKNALQLDPHDAAARSNLAEVLLKLRRFPDALREATKAMERFKGTFGDITSSKIASRIVRACLDMGLYSRALAELDKFQERLSSSPLEEKEKSFLTLVIPELREEAQRLLGQRERGEYDWKAVGRELVEMDEKKTTVEPKRLSDYVGPVKVIDGHPKYGRTLVATRDIEPGELILVCNPISQMKVDPVVTKTGRHLVSYEDPIVELCRRFLEDPWVREVINSLYGGSDRRPPVPVFHREYFTSPNEEEEEEEDEEEEEMDDGDYHMDGREQLDVDNLVKCLKVNAFGSNSDDTNCLYFLASFATHSCVPNCHRCFVGKNVMVIRAAYPIRSGDVITIDYRGGESWKQPVELRRTNFQNWGFTCDCELCEAETEFGAAYKTLVAEAEARLKQLGKESGNPTERAWTLKLLKKIETTLTSFKGVKVGNRKFDLLRLRFVDQYMWRMTMSRFKPFAKETLDALDVLTPIVDATIRASTQHMMFDWYRASIMRTELRNEVDTEEGKKRLKSLALGLKIAYGFDEVLTVEDVKLVEGLGRKDGWSAVLLKPKQCFR